MYQLSTNDFNMGLKQMLYYTDDLLFDEIFWPFLDIFDEGRNATICIHLYGVHAPCYSLCNSLHANMYLSHPYQENKVSDEPVLAFSKAH